MFSKILIALKSLDSLEQFEDFLLQLHLTENTQFYLLHVIEKFETVMQWPSEIYKSEATQMLLTVAEKLKTRFGDLNIVTNILDGEVNEVILSVAETWQPELILLQSHHKEGVERFLPDSVCSYLPSHSPCTTVVLKRKHD